jgi:hypothetical protein
VLVDLCDRRFALELEGKGHAPDDIIDAAFRLAIVAAT